MDVAGDRASLQTGQQAGDELEVRAVDELAVGLERVGAVGDAIENGAGPDRIKQQVQVGIDQEVHGPDVVRRQALEPPRRRPGRGAVHVVANAEQRAHQVGPDETAGAKNQDRALQPPDLFDDRGWWPWGGLGHL